MQLIDHRTIGSKIRITNIGRSPESIPEGGKIAIVMNDVLNHSKSATQRRIKRTDKPEIHDKRTIEKTNQKRSCSSGSDLANAAFCEKNSLSKRLIAAKLHTGNDATLKKRTETLKKRSIFGVHRNNKTNIHIQYLYTNYTKKQAAQARRKHKMFYVEQKEEQGTKEKESTRRNPLKQAPTHASEKTQIHADNEPKRPITNS